jgi:hypothetical protein
MEQDRCSFGSRADHEHFVTIQIFNHRMLYSNGTLTEGPSDRSYMTMIVVYRKRHGMEACNTIHMQMEHGRTMIVVACNASMEHDS